MTKEEAIKRIKDWNLDNDKIEVLSIIIPELKENENEKIRKAIFKALSKKDARDVLIANGIQVSDALTWLKNQDEQKPNPYSGVGFVCNGHTWGMCARDNGVDILLDKQLFKHLDEKQGEQTTDKIIEKARTEKQRILLTETNGDSHIDWDCRSLQDVKSLLKYGLEYIDAQLEKQSENNMGISEATKKKLEDNLNKALEKETPGSWNKFLDKQDEQKPADKVKPKFKVGDWCIDNEDGIIFQIVKVLDNTYRYKTNEGGEYACTHYSLEEDARLWTIEDAKDGDVLANKYGAIFINAGSSNERGTVDCYCYLSVQNEFFIEDHKTGSWLYKEILKPATKEQRDLLFTKMKEAGYEWDAEKKELKEIEQKPTWSEEDEETIDRIYNFLWKNRKGDTSEIYQQEKDATWLKSLKERMVSQPKQEWGEEDEEMFDAIIADIQFTQKAHNHEVNQVVYEREIDWFKSLKDRVQPQSIQELSKEVINEYVDLGLSSGTLWKHFNEEGYYTYDEAVDKFGDNLPSKEQWKELIDECKCVWKGNGYDVIGPNGNMIYLPADGVHADVGVCDVGTDGHYWSYTNDKEGYAWDMYFDKDDNPDMYLGLRYYGRSVRLVK